MRLHTLTFQAVGPYPDRHTIDFARLGAGGLFLLEGPTGAGKSTIIDAIVYALYGTVAAGASSEDRLRSTHVGPEVSSYVDLVLETGAGIYRVRRSPAYDRPKQRGTGTTRQQTKVNLWRLSTADLDALDPARDLGDQEPGTFVSNRADEVGAEMTRVVGLTRDQLVQTIVLPQGEFASFLRARPEERSALLQRVFGTELFQKVQAQLVEGRKAAQAEVKDADAAVVSAVAGFAAAVTEGEDADELRALGSSPTGSDALLARVAEHVGRIEGEATAAAAARDAAVTRHAAREDEARAARTTLGLVTRRASARARLAELDAAAEEHAADVARLAAARRAAGVVARLDDVDTATARVTAAGDALEAAQESAAEHTRVADLLAAPDADPAALADGVATTVGRLEHLVELESRLAGRVRALEARAEALDRRRAAAVADAEALEARPVARAELAAALEAAQRAAGVREERREALEAALHARTAVTDLAAHDVRAAAAETLLAERARATQAAVDTEARLRRARIDGIAGELARELAPGEPCAVCGGTDHPAPAPLDDDHVAAEQVEAASEARAAAEAALLEARDARAALDAERSALVERARGRTLEQAETAVTEARAAVDAAEVAVAETARLGEQIAAHDAETVALRARVDAARDETTATAATLETERAALDDDSERVRAAVTEHAAGTGVGHGAHDITDEAGADEAVSPVLTVTLADVRDDLVEQEQLLRAVARAVATHATAAAALAEARERLEAALADAELDDAAAARAAALDRPATHALEASVKAYEQQLTTERATLTDPDVAAVPDELDVPGATAALEAAEEALRVARDARDAALATTTTTEGTLARARTCRETVAEAVGSARGAREATAAVIRMADLADASTSDNAAALTLTTYVLARRFDEVLDAANDRLRLMSSGRYELRRSDAREKGGGRRLGLALRVRDHATESDREPTTLSGGETFYVSLCLALGLADVVTAEAGGIDLGTLFVDEGFGSLDPGTLDLVMTELGHLRAGGRVVGVVSHVDAMKQTIADRISVRRLPDGSSTLEVVAG